MHQQLHELLQKRMDRKDFLKHVAIGAVLATGLGTVMKYVAPQTNQQARQFGYGGGAYGGNRTPRA